MNWEWLSVDQNELRIKIWDNANPEEAAIIRIYRRLNEEGRNRPGVYKRSKYGKKALNNFFNPLKGLNLFVFSNKQLQLNI